MKLIVVAFLTVALVFLTACGGGSDKTAATETSGSAAPSGASVEATATKSPTPQATIAEATDTPVPASATATPTETPAPTDTPEPTATPEPPTATPEPPTATSAPPTATTAPAPTATSASPPPSGRGSTAYLTAQNLAFSPTTLYASAGTVTISLTNKDNYVPHNVSVDGLGTSATCSGPCTVTLTVSAAPGTYPFHCTVHPYMTGTLVVQ